MGVTGTGMVCGALGAPPTGPPCTVIGTVCAGVGAGVGAFWPVTGSVFLIRSGVPLPPRVARIESVSEVSINTTAETVVAFESIVADPRGPKTVCDPMPPNAPARSAALPLCSNTTSTRTRHTIT